MALSLKNANRLTTFKRSQSRSTTSTAAAFKQNLSPLSRPYLSWKRTTIQLAYVEAVFYRSWSSQRGARRGKQPPGRTTWPVQPVMGRGTDFDPMMTRGCRLGRGRACFSNATAMQNRKIRTATRPPREGTHLHVSFAPWLGHQTEEEVSGVSDVSVANFSLRLFDYSIIQLFSFIWYCKGFSTLMHND